MIRLFVAIDFPKQIKSQLADLVDQIQEDGYPLVFEKEANFHLTLKFLGWTGEGPRTKNQEPKTARPTSKLEEINKAIQKATSGVKPFWFRLAQIGYFLRESLVLWLGVEEPAFVKTSTSAKATVDKSAGKQEELVKLVNNLENEFVKIGFAKEKRTFSSHVTFGKRRQAAPLGKWRSMAEEIKNKFHPQISSFQVKSIVLMQSTLTPQGSIYTPIKKFPLKI